PTIFFAILYPHPGEGWGPCPPPLRPLTYGSQPFAGMLAPLRGAHTFSTCEYSSSTGVARPKIDTATLSRDFSSSTSSTTPLNEVKGPSETRTCSPTSKVIDGFGRSTPSCTCRMIRAASASLIGLGRPRPPRKPVTLAVFLTRCQVSSSRSILIST